MEELRLKSTIGGGLLCTINLFVEVSLAFKNVWNRIGVFMVEEEFVNLREKLNMSQI